MLQRDLRRSAVLKAFGDLQQRQIFRTQASTTASSLTTATFNCRTRSGLRTLLGQGSVRVVFYAFVEFAPVNSVARPWRPPPAVKELHPSLHRCSPAPAPCPQICTPCDSPRTDCGVASVLGIFVPAFDPSKGFRSCCPPAPATRAPIPSVLTLAPAPAPTQVDCTFANTPAHVPESRKNNFVNSDWK